MKAAGWALVNSPPACNGPITRSASICRVAGCRPPMIAYCSTISPWPPTSPRHWSSMPAPSTGLRKAASHPAMPSTATRRCPPSAPARSTPGCGWRSPIGSSWSPACSTSPSPISTLMPMAASMCWATCPIAASKPPSPGRSPPRSASSPAAPGCGPRSPPPALHPAALGNARWAPSVSVSSSAPIGGHPSPPASPSTPASPIAVRKPPR